MAMQPAARLERLGPYQPPPDDERIDLRLDANEGVGPGASVLEALRGVDADTVRRYPSAVFLERALADRWGVDPSCVVVTNGGDDAIDRLCRATVEPGRTMVTHAPSFEMIERSARLAGGQVLTVAWEQGPFPVSDLLALVSERTGLVALVTPNNPTGATIDLHHLVEVAQAAAQSGAVVLVDLAYVEFAATDPTSALLEERNVVVVRTFSKAWGLAGLRVGYALTSATVAGWLRTVGGPYPTASTSLAAAAACLSTDVRSYVDQVRSERERLTALLAALGGWPLASEANFVTCRSVDAGGVREGMARRGIGIRAFASPMLGDAVRITLPGDEAIFGRLTRALSEVLGGRS